jgi:hypothetical protein
MHSRDDFYREKSYNQRGHSRGKSMNNASIESINPFKESIKNNINLNYTKSIYIK